MIAPAIKNPQLATTKQVITCVTQAANKIKNIIVSVITHPN